MKVNMHEAKSQLSALGEKAWQGEEIIIAKAGKPYLELRPYRPKRTPRTPGRCKGQIVIAPDFDVTPEEIIRAFEGDE
ncbi:MAG: type II toxin-antitoxin system prevent-host-death family antitoxin [Desulfuromonadales bacterium]|nr:type II toxin-antitoxin system prevent-host-death family antitoxin [Desulfuromonadales bacterium]